MKQIDLSKYTKDNIGELLEISINWKQAREADFHRFAKYAAEHHISKFYVNSAWFLPYILEDLNDTDVIPGSFIGTCAGGFSTEMKCFETRHAIDEGAKAIVNAMDLSAILNGHWDYVEKDVEAMRKAADEVELTLTLGAPYLNEDQLTKCAELAAKYEVDYVLTSPVTNFFNGPSIYDVLTLKKVLNDTSVGIKAGGIKYPYAQNAYMLMRAGAEKVIAWECETLIDEFDLMRDVGIIPACAS